MKRQVHGHRRQDIHPKGIETVMPLSTIARKVGVSAPNVSGEVKVNRIYVLWTAAL